MRLFADHCVPTDVVETLRALGMTVQRAYEVELDQAADEELFEHVQKKHQVLLSFDQDFANMVRFNVTHSPGIVIVDPERFSKTSLLRRVEGFFRTTPESTLRGRLHILQPHRTRTWPNPQRATE